LGRHAELSVELLLALGELGFELSQPIGSAGGAALAL
jgi:hypothetical protein